MKLSNILEYLKYGELSHLDIVNFETNPENRKKIISNINLGLIELYKRFPIQLKEVVIQEYEHITTYYLDSMYSEYSGTATYKYIKDSSYYPFTNDVISIEAIYDEDGQEFPLNDDTKTYSLFTPSYNSIQVPFPDNENAILVMYRAGATTIALTAVDDTEINIPPQLAEALSNYVAYKIFGSLNMNTAESVNYYSKFEMSCNIINNLGLFTTSNNRTNMKLELNGWV